MPGVEAPAEAPRANTEGQRPAPQFVPPGHFYSPIPTLDDIARVETQVRLGPWLPAGIDLHEREQLALLEQFRSYYGDAEFPAEKHPAWRYYYKNPAYSYSDAFFLHAMIRQARPRRIIEVGSGYSSCLTLDTNERFFGNSIQCTFVEPYPSLLLSLLHDGDAGRVRIWPVPAQQVPAERFGELESGDILFIDSTHVVRPGSDVNHLFFSILPALAPGVYVHIHDIFYPWEYPSAWLREGRQWGELYLLRALLMFSRRFDVVLMNTFLEFHHKDLMQAVFPLCAANPGGSIWLRTVGS